MINLLFLLLGKEAITSRKQILYTIGGLSIVVAILLFIDLLTDGKMTVPINGLALIILIEGLITSASAVLLPGKVERQLLTKGMLFVIAAVFVLLQNEKALWLKAAIFAIFIATDGLFRLTSASLVQNHQWKNAFWIGFAEVLFAFFIMLNKPITYAQTIPLCISTLLLLSGITFIRLARSSIELAESNDESVQTDSPEWLEVFIWTPQAGIGSERKRRNFIARYIAAMDVNGKVSTGHAAVRLANQSYLSLYPVDDIDRSVAEVIKLLKASADNDMAGRFVESLAIESEEWMAPTCCIRLPVYQVERVKQFMEDYKQNTTYNLTRRNCSTATIDVLDVAMTNILSQHFGLRGLAHLFFNPYFWTLAFIRGKGQSMTWTPGLVLDYVIVLDKLLRHEMAWTQAQQQKKRPFFSWR